MDITKLLVLPASLPFLMLAAAMSVADAAPLYKPSSRSPEPQDIRTNAYGQSRSAPNALGIGDRAPDFTVPRAGGGAVALSDKRKEGPVVVIFYRGHW